MTGEEARFRAAFKAVLERDPNTAPGPTALNRELGRTGPRLNTINGRLNAVRKRLLIEAGFTQETKWSRWRKT